MTEIPRLEADLQEHQELATLWCQDRKKFVLADDVGLGKTLSCLAHIADLWAAGELQYRDSKQFARVLWLTDASLIAQTVAEIQRFLPGAVVVTSDHPVFKGTTTQRVAARKAIGGRCDFWVLSHEMAHKQHHSIDSVQPAMLVIDEASKLKGGAAINKTITALARRTPRVVAITATLLENHPMELWNILAATNVTNLWPKRIFENEFVTWRVVENAYGRPSREPVGWQPGVAGSVLAFLDGCVLRRTAEECGIKLPVRVGETLRICPLSGAQQLAYQEAEGKPGRSIHGLEGAILDVSEGSPILDNLLGFLEAAPGESTVVFGERLPLLDAIGRALEGAGILYARIQGSSNAADRVDAVRRHMSGEVQVLLGSIVLERGLNLQHCRRMVSVGSSWNPAREAQREGRIRRIGSPFADYEHLSLLPDTPLAKAQLGVLDRKLDVAREVGLA